MAFKSRARRVSRGHTKAWAGLRDTSKERWHSPRAWEEQAPDHLEGWLSARVACEPAMVPAVCSAARPTGQSVRVCGASLCAPAAKWFHLVGPASYGFLLT